MNRVPLGVLGAIALMVAVRFLSYFIKFRIAADPHGAAPLLALGGGALAIVTYVLFRLGRWLDVGPDNDARIYTICFLMAAVILGGWSARIMVDPFFPHDQPERSIIQELR